MEGLFHISVNQNNIFNVEQIINLGNAALMAVNTCRSKLEVGFERLSFVCFISRY